MKSWIFAWYCFVGKITREFPLSALAIMASLFLSFAFMDLMVLVSGCVLCLVWEWLFIMRVFMRSAVSFLYTSRSERGSFDSAVSTSRARFCIQLSFLECRLYLGPFSSSVISWLVKVMFVLFMTLGWKSCFCRGVFLFVTVSVV